MSEALEDPFQRQKRKIREQLSALAKKAVAGMVPRPGIDVDVCFDFEEGGYFWEVNFKARNDTEVLLCEVASGRFEKLAEAEGLSCDDYGEGEDDEGLFLGPGGFVALEPPDEG